jgi:soluble lytic murein transglycosylase-like protein
MNYAAGILVIAGGAALIMGIRGSYKNIWSGLTGQSIPTLGGQSSGDFGSSNDSLTTLAQQDAIAAGIDPTYFLKQIQQESGFNPKAVSPAGAQGIAQFMPGTAASLGVNPWDPAASLKAAANYMGQLVKKYGGSEAKALAAYNAGEGTVNAAIQHSQQSGLPWQTFLPYETQKYITTIEGSYN